MDLRRSVGAGRAWLAALAVASTARVGLVALTGLTGCASDTPFEVDASAVSFPTTVLSAYRVAETIATELAERPYPVRLGGSFAVLDAEGRGRNHTFVFASREGAESRELTVHLFSGIPNLNGRTVLIPPIPFRDFSLLLDSDVAVAAAIDAAEAWNATDPVERIPITESFAAQIYSQPVWPLDWTDDDPPDEVAWRVDFLEMDVAPTTGALVWWSLGRIYLDAETGVPLGDPFFPEDGREIYDSTDRPD